MKKKIILAITGASGTLYAVQFLKLLQKTDVEVHGIISDAGKKVLELETGMAPEDLAGISKWFAAGDFTAPMASGSSIYHAMAVLPCTMGTLAAISAGMSVNLIHRTADVMLKEKKKLLLAVRETPFNRTHMTNMLKVHDAGAIICPAMPAMYLKPESIEEMAAQYAGRVAGLLGIDIPGLKRWGDQGLGIRG